MVEVERTAKKPEIQPAARRPKAPPINSNESLKNRIQMRIQDAKKRKLEMLKRAKERFEQAQQRRQ